MKQNNMRTINELEAAQRYVFKQPTLVLGRSKQLECVIARLKMPALPRLMSNIEQRKQLQKPGVLRTLLQGARGRIEIVNKVVADAIEQEKRKPFFVPLYSLEQLDTDEQLPEPLTYEQFKQLCNE